MDIQTIKFICPICNKKSDILMEETNVVCHSILGEVIIEENKDQPAKTIDFGFSDMWYVGGDTRNFKCTNCDNILPATNFDDLYNYLLDNNFIDNTIEEIK